MPEANEEQQRAANALLRLLCVAIFVTALDLRSVAPLLPAVSQDLGVTVAAAGLIVTAYGVPYAFFQLGYGPLGDRIGRLRVICVAYVVFLAGAALSSLAPTLPLLIMARALAGGAAAAVFPMALAHIGDNFSYARRQQAVGLLMSTSSTAGVLSVSIGGMIGEFLSWRLLYAFFALLGIPVWALLLRAQRAAPPPLVADGPFPTSLRQRAASVVAQFATVFRAAAAKRIFALVFVENFFLIGGFSYVGAGIHDRFEVGLLLVGVLLIGYGVGSVVAAQLIGRLVRRLGEHRLVLGGGLTMSAGFLLAFIMPRAELGFVAAVLMGAGFIAAHTTFQTRMTEVAPSVRGTALSLFAFHGVLGQAVGAAAFGALLAAGGYGTVLLTSMVGLLLFSLVAGTTLPQRTPHPSASRA